MLVRRGVIHRVDAIGLEHVTQPDAVVHRADQRHDQIVGQPVAGDDRAHFPVDVVKGRLRQIEQDQPAGLLREYLPAKRRANGAARPRDEDGLAPDAGLQQILHRRNRVALEQILDIDVPHMRHVDVAGYQLGDIGDRLHSDG